MTEKEILQERDRRFEMLNGIMEKENLDSLMIDLGVAAVAGEGENRFVFYTVGDMASSAILDAYQKHLKE